MPKKPANPNTAYGRKRLREEHHQWKENLTPEQRKEVEANNTLAYVIVVGIIMLMVFLMAGSGGLLQWLTR